MNYTQTGIEENFNNSATYMQRGVNNNLGIIERSNVVEKTAQESLLVKASFLEDFD